MSVSAKFGSEDIFSPTLEFECSHETSNDSDVLQSARNPLLPKICEERPVSTSTRSKTRELLSMKGRAMGSVTSLKTGDGIPSVFHVRIFRGLSF
jgi:hypothetical protein